MNDDTSSEPIGPFDRRLVRAHRDRAARRFAEHDFLLREVAGRLTERLEEIDQSFPTVLDLGCHHGLLRRRLSDRFGIETVIQSDMSPPMLALAEGPRVVADEEAIPFATGRFDLIVSVLTLHWVNDLPGALLQVNQCLRPGGLLLAAMLGGNTLGDLREAFLRAETEHEGGASPRVSPVVDVRDGGALLQRAGFASPVADVESITVSHEDPIALMLELRGMGEANALRHRSKTFTRRKTLLAAADILRQTAADDNGRVTTTFDVLWLTGRAPV